MCVVCKGERQPVWLTSPQPARHCSLISPLLLSFSLSLSLSLSRRACVLLQQTNAGILRSVMLIFFANADVESCMGCGFGLWWCLRSGLCNTFCWCRCLCEPSLRPYTPSVRHPCAPSPPTVRGLCTRYAPSMRPLCAHCALTMQPSMRSLLHTTWSLRPLCAHYARSMHPLHSHYVPSMRALCVQYHPLCLHDAPTVRPLSARYAPAIHQSKNPKYR